MGVHVDWRDDYDLARERLADAQPRLLGLRLSLNPIHRDESEDRPAFRGEGARDERDRGFKSEEAT